MWVKASFIKDEGTNERQLIEIDEHDEGIDIVVDGTVLLTLVASKDVELLIHSLTQVNNNYSKSL